MVSIMLLLPFLRCRTHRAAPIGRCDKGSPTTAYSNLGTELGHFHVGFASPDPQLRKASDERLGVLRVCHGDAALVEILRGDACPPEQRQGRFDVADELAVSKGISNEIPGSGFL